MQYRNFYYFFWYVYIFWWVGSHLLCTLLLFVFLENSILVTYCFLASKQKAPNTLFAFQGIPNVYQMINIQLFLFYHLVHSASNAVWLTNQYHISLRILHEKSKSSTNCISNPTGCSLIHHSIFISQKDLKYPLLLLVCMCLLKDKLSKNKALSYFLDLSTSSVMQIIF